MCNVKVVICCNARKIAVMITICTCSLCMNWFYLIQMKYLFKHVRSQRWSQEEFVERKLLMSVFE